MSKLVTLSNLNKKLLIGVPYYRHLSIPIIAVSEDVTCGMGPKGYKSAMCMNDSVLVHDSRNQIVDIALNMNVDWLFFIDSDMGFDADAMRERDAAGQNPICSRIAQLLDHRLDICSGLAVGRKAPHLPCVYQESPDDPTVFDPIIDPPKEGVHEVDAVGAAFLAISRHVLNRLKEHEKETNEPIFWYRARRDKNGVLRRIGEDMLFCLKARELGFKIHCDFGIHIGHESNIYVEPGHYFGSYQEKVLAMNPPKPVEETVDAGA